MMTEQAIRRYLRKFGYHIPLGILGEDVATAGDDAFRMMVEELQSFIGLKSDGIAGSKTQQAMEMPRCGVPDYRRSGKSDPKFHEACSMGIGVYADWSGIKGTTPKRANELMVHNFEQVAPYNLRFWMAKTGREALINIRMGKADRGVLAWMELGDGCDWQRQSLFNIDVDWSDELLFGGTNMHEVVGHGTGVAHSPDIGSIMDAIYDPDIENKIDLWFGNQLRTRYGLIGQPPTEQPKNKNKMGFAEIIAIILPMILECIENRQSEDAILARLRNPNQRQLRRLSRSVNREVKKQEPGLRKRDRRIRVDALVDDILIRRQEMSNAELGHVIDDAKRSHRVQSCE